MPFRVPLDAPVSSLAAGEKQKLEILKLLYLDQRFLILDEPTSVLTPGEADEMLGLLRGMAERGEITVLMITHKFREVTAFCRRRHRAAARQARPAAARSASSRRDEMAAMMIGDTDDPRARRAQARTTTGADVLETRRPLRRGRRRAAGASTAVNLKVQAGEIVGIAGVSGNGQSGAGRGAGRAAADAATAGIFIHGEPFEPTREHFDRFKVFGLPEEPLKNATVPTHDGGREHGLPRLRQAADRQARLVAVARADARRRRAS